MITSPHTTRDIRSRASTPDGWFSGITRRTRLFLPENVKVQLRQDDLSGLDRAKLRHRHPNKLTGRVMGCADPQIPETALPTRTACQLHCLVRRP